MKRLFTPSQRYAFLTVLILLLTSCQQEINLDRYRNKDTEQMLTVNAIVCPDSTIAASATKPFLYSSDHLGREHIRGLSITVGINGTVVDTMRFSEQHSLYVCNSRPQVGDTVTLRTTYGGQEVLATTHVPNAVAIDTVTTRMYGTGDASSNSTCRFIYHITFRDPAARRNYYFLWIDKQRYGYTDAYSWGEMVTGMDWSHEMVFQNLARDVNNGIANWNLSAERGLPFSDRDIDGQEYTISVVEEDLVADLLRGPRRDTERRIRLFSITEDYYRYLVSVLTQQQEDEGVAGGMLQLGIVESHQLHTNITGGLGLIGGYALSTKEINLWP